MTLVVQSFLSKLKAGDLKNILQQDIKGNQKIIRQYPYLKI